jgi:hypothetical protein
LDTFGEDRRLFLDVLAGVALPILCFALDPFAFKTSRLSLGGEPAFGSWQAAAYLFVAIEIVVLVVYLVRAPEGPRANAAAAGFLWAGGLAALGAGAFLLPLALMTLFIGIGLLGLVPWWTARTFLRHAARATRRAVRLRGGAGWALVLAAWSVLLIPVGAAWIGRSTLRGAVARLDAGGPGAVEEAAASLNRWSVLIRHDELVRAHRLSPHADTRARIEAAYRAWTGRDMPRPIPD